MSGATDLRHKTSGGSLKGRNDAIDNSSIMATTSTRIGHHSPDTVSEPTNLNFLVSEHEDEDEEADEDITDNCTTLTTGTNFTRPTEVKQNSNFTKPKPAPIPLDPVENDNNDSGEESDYSYDYEDDDDCHISGFLISEPDTNEELANTIPQDIPTESSVAHETSTSTSYVSLENSVPSKPPEKERNLNTTSCKTTNECISRSQSSSFAGSDSTSTVRKSTWKEPSQAAVSMSLRAEKEKTGGKRRLASDLYKIMMNDTEDAGFSLEPSSEDSMEKWKIKLFKFDKDSNLHKDLMALKLDHVELEMSFPDQYPFEPPFVRVVKPRFKRQTGFVMNGAICSELLTNEGWNPVNDIESVIVSIRSLLVVGNGRLAAAVNLPERKKDVMKQRKRKGDDSSYDSENDEIIENIKRPRKANFNDSDDEGKKKTSSRIGQYTAAEARAAYSHLSDYHKKKGWDSTGWWARKG